ncbi:MAG: chromate efflux transporter [Candidatus Symbiobacter sp.]|nr:chromate efflux transporter [Candidatus Symbiobacter sp.]
MSSVSEPLAPDAPPQLRTPWEIFVIYLRLGLTCFGGSIAHIGYFHAEIVKKRGWVSERDYGDIVALCNFLPGPTSSQISMTIGLMQAGFWGAFAAWLGFSLPSFLFMAGVAQGLTRFGDVIPNSALHGLQLMAVAVVAQAVWGMGRNLLRQAWQFVIMFAGVAIIILVPDKFIQIYVMLAAGVLGLVLFKPQPILGRDVLRFNLSRRVGFTLLVIFFGLLVGLPILDVIWPHHYLEFITAFYRAGSLVFGGGYVLLPLLQSEAAANNWLSPEILMAGYGATLALPGPVFSFAAFLGGAMTVPPNGWLGSGLAYIAIFGPSFLLIGGVLPFWHSVLRNPRAQAAMLGVNAAVVAVLAAALYDPIWRNGVHHVADVAVVLVVLAVLLSGKVPSWLLVFLAGGICWGLGINP